MVVLIGGLVCLVVGSVVNISGGIRYVVVDVESRFTEKSHCSGLYSSLPLWKVESLFTGVFTRFGGLTVSRLE